MTASLYMKRARELAEKAKALGEVPVGAVVVKNGEIIGEGYNSRETRKNPLGHAEITAIESAAKKLTDWRLTDCDLYVTLEPCPMCAGAIIGARISRVFYGAFDNKAGSFGSLTDLSALPYETVPEIHAGIGEDACKKQLTDFFKRLR